jgi:hypothetical protein
MKMYSERRGLASFILNLSAGRRWRVNFENRPHYLRERTAIPTSYENPWASQSVWVFWRKEMSFAPAGFRALDRPVLGLVAISNKCIQPKKKWNFSPFFLPFLLLAYMTVASLLATAVHVNCSFVASYGLIIMLSGHCYRGKYVAAYN